MKVLFALPLVAIFAFSNLADARSAREVGDISSVGLGGSTIVGGIIAVSLIPAELAGGELGSVILLGASGLGGSVLVPGLNDLGMSKADAQKLAVVVRSIQEDAAVYLASGGEIASPVLQAIFSITRESGKYSDEEVARRILGGNSTVRP